GAVALIQAQLRHQRAGRRTNFGELALHIGGCSITRVLQHALLHAVELVHQLELLLAAAQVDGGYVNLSEHRDARRQTLLAGEIILRFGGCSNRVRVDEIEEIPARLDAGIAPFAVDQEAVAVVMSAEAELDARQELGERLVSLVEADAFIVAGLDEL